MRRFTAGLLVAMVAGPAAACSGGPGPTAGPSAASARTVSCSSASGTDDVGQKLTFTGCTGATGGSGTVMGPFASPTVVHWASGGTTQVVFDTDRKVTGNPACATQLTAMGGKVLSSTVPGIGGEVHGAFCIDADRRVSLVPGTRFTL